ncbi:MAG: thioredoxin family protein [Anaerolineales bacterium]|nr:thioredoxin family protein [Anaerolineales bacterium]
MQNLKLGEKAPVFKLPDTAGKEHSLADYPDQLVGVIFSCNHCPYVRSWEDRMVEIQADYADKGVQLLAINANDAHTYPADSYSGMKRRVQEKDFNFPYLRDETQDIAMAFAAERTPEVFLFDQEGKLAYHGAIDDNYDEPENVKQHYLRDALDSLLSGEVPDPAETRAIGCTIKWK